MIKIEKNKEERTFEFYNNGKKLPEIYKQLCPKCEVRESSNPNCCYYSFGISLDPAYVYIISKLKDAGLLDEDYEMRCCNCYDT